MDRARIYRTADAVIYRAHRGHDGDEPVLRRLRLRIRRESPKSKRDSTIILLLLFYIIKRIRRRRRRRPTRDRCRRRLGRLGRRTMARGSRPLAGSKHVIYTVPYHVFYILFSRRY